MERAIFLSVRPIINGEFPFTFDHKEPCTNRNCSTTKKFMMGLGNSGYGLRESASEFIPKPLAVSTNYNSTSKSRSE